LYDARYVGQSFELDVAYESTVEDLAQAFHAQHGRRYGYSVPEDAIELVNARINAVGRLPAHERRHVRAHYDPTESGKRHVWINGHLVGVAVHAREALDEHTVLVGPTLIEQYDTCTYVAPGWRARVDGPLITLERIS
jgi:N-methylhydantoinase A